MFMRKRTGFKIGLGARTELQNNFITISGEILLTRLAISKPAVFKNVSISDLLIDQPSDPFGKKFLQLTEFVLP